MILVCIIRLYIISIQPHHPHHYHHHFTNHYHHPHHYSNHYNHPHHFSNHYPHKVLASAAVRLFKVDSTTNNYVAVANGDLLGCVLMGTVRAFQILVYNGQVKSIINYHHLYHHLYHHRLTYDHNHNKHCHYHQLASSPSLSPSYLFYIITIITIHHHHHYHHCYYHDNDRFHRKSLRLQLLCPHHSTIHYGAFIYPSLLQLGTTNGPYYLRPMKL